MSAQPGTLTNLLKEVFIQEKDIDRENHRVRVCVSDGSIDRDEEVIIPESYEKWLPTYRQNPIFCWGHPLGYGKNAPPDHCLGKAVDIGLAPNVGLVANFEYAVEINQTAKQVWDLVDGGYLRSYSVGVIPHKYVTWYDDKEVIAALAEPYRTYMIDGKCWACYTESELVEVSQVFVGSNRSALIRAVSDGCVALQAAKSWCPGLLVPRYYAGADLKTGPAGPEGRPSMHKQLSKDEAPPDETAAAAEEQTQEPETPAPLLSEDDAEEQEFEQFLEECPEAAALLLELLQ